jgi:hypothetical protein
MHGAARRNLMLHNHTRAGVMLSFRSDLIEFNKIKDL